MTDLGLTQEFTFQLDCCVESGLIPPYVTEFHFAKHAIGRLWRADFAWPARDLLVEVEGGTFKQVPGRHSRGKAYQEDCYKYATAAILGYTVIRGDTDMVSNGHLLEFVIDFLTKRDTPSIQKLKGERLYRKMPSV